MKDALLVVLKFIVAAVLLPVVMGTTYAFQTELSTFDPVMRDILLAGTVTYVILRFFVYDFAGFYAFGQKLVAAMFPFFKPLVEVAPFVLPIYTLLIVMVYGVTVLLGVSGEWQEMFLFLTAFTFTMHVVLTAQDLYAKDTKAGKPDYFFGMALIYILDVFLVSLVMSLAIKGFSFPNFFQTLAKTSWGIYLTVFRQLF